MTIPFPTSGLYAVTDSLRWPGSNLLTAVRGAIEGGACVIQYREKRANPDIGLAKKMLELCHDNEVPLVINDHVDLALRIGADGVHLGRNDEAVIHARRRIGERAIVGVSCYDSVSKAARAEAEGASYVAFGSFFRSRTKPDASPVDLETLERVSVAIPVVAIGGITHENGKTLIDSGADLLAVVSGIFGQPDPAQAASSYRELFEARKSVRNPD